MERVVTFGEAMLRLSPPGFSRLVQATVFERTFGGAELNVAVDLAQWGVDVAFISKLPDNEIAQACLQEARGLGVDTLHVSRGGARMGIYFYEMGAAQRPSTVVYDRAHSAIAEAEPTEWKWNALLDGATIFHVTGITPALSVHCAQATLDAVRTARERGITVSCDLNYRSKLWSREEAGRTMAEILPYVDYANLGPEDAEALFAIRADTPEAVARKLTERFGFRGVAMTRRESHSASRNGWMGILFTNDTIYHSQSYEIEHIVDRLGAGDAFTAGLLYGLAQHLPPQETVEFAAASACLKHSIAGDFNFASVSEIRSLMAGDGSGRVRR